jgi:hypothetical protein
MKMLIGGELGSCTYNKNNIPSLSVNDAVLSGQILELGLDYQIRAADGAGKLR